MSVCPFSNVILRVFDDLTHHTLPTLLREGLRASVHSDDPAYFGGYVNDNLRGVVRKLPITAADGYQLLRNSLESSFMEPSEIARHVARLDEVFANG